MATEKTMKNAGRAADIRAFASAVKQMMEQAYPSCTVEIHDVCKNNNQMRTGILICGEGRNIAPTIYLEKFFEAYRDGKPLGEICRTIRKIHQETNPAENFDVSSVTDFAAVKGKICYKLVNAERNPALLRNVPHRLWQDLAIVYYISIPPDFADCISSITVENRMLGMWGVDENTLYGLASRNTPALFGAEVMPMSEAVHGMLQEMQEAGEDISRFLDAEEPEYVSQLYVATNNCKYNGAAVLLYDGVLEKFAERINGDFFILPSSVHETLLMPVPPDADGRWLPGMVREINTEKVAPEEVLSDNAYLYCARDHSVRLIS